MIPWLRCWVKVDTSHVTFLLLSETRDFLFFSFIERIINNDKRVFEILFLLLTPNSRVPNPILNRDRQGLGFDPVLISDWRFQSR